MDLAQPREHLQWRHHPLLRRRLACDEEARLLLERRSAAIGSNPMLQRWNIITVTVLAVAIAGCAAPDRPVAERPAPDTKPMASKKITAAMMGNPSTVVQRTIGGGTGNVPGSAQ